MFSGLAKVQISMALLLALANLISSISSVPSTLTPAVGSFSTGAAVKHQFHNGGVVAAFGVDPNGNSSTGDVVNATNQLGAEQAADLAGHSSNGLLVAKEGDFASSSVYFRIQNNTGATVTDWTFTADVFYEEGGGSVSTATFGYAVDNSVIAPADGSFTFFGAASAAANGDTYATLAYSLDETVTTTGVADGDYLILGFFDDLNNSNGSGIVIDDISVTAVLTAVPEPSSFLLLGSISLLVMLKNRRVRS